MWLLNQLTDLVELAFVQNGVSTRQCTVSQKLIIRSKRLKPTLGNIFLFNMGFKPSFISAARWH